MDPLTHGLTGALIGKGFFVRGSANPPENGTAARIALFAAVLGAVFPDCDVVSEFFAKNDLSIIEYHRNITHSFVCLPLFAVALAALTHWVLRGKGIARPSFGLLTGIYAAGLASHIVLDWITSFGTMIWSPLSHRRASLDLVFIVDFTMMAVVLAPQVAARIFRAPRRAAVRAVGAWVVLTLCAAGIERLARMVGFPFSLWAVGFASLVLAALFFVPFIGGRGFRVPQPRWSRAGLYSLAVYLLVCAVAHHTALARVEGFAADRQLKVQDLGALPLPPSLGHWAGLVRTPDGVYEVHYNLLRRQPADARFFADSEANRYLEAARRLPEVQTYLWFARFPVFRFQQREGRAEVDIADLRFFRRGSRSPAPFTFRVTFDASGQVLRQGLVRR